MNKSDPCFNEGSEVVELHFLQWKAFNIHIPQHYSASLKSNNEKYCISLQPKMLNQDIIASIKYLVAAVVTVNQWEELQL